MGSILSTRWGGHRRRMTLGEAFLVLQAPRAGGGDWAAVLGAADGAGEWGAVRWTAADGSPVAAMALRVERSPGAGAGFWLRLRWRPTPDGPRLAGPEAPGAVDSRVRVEPVALTYGRRWFLACPACGRRRAALYLPAPHYTAWRCRACWHLGYHSQRLAPHNRLTHRARKLSARLGAEWRGPDTVGRPPKPHPMHWRTYERRLAALRDVEDRRNAVFFGYLARIGHRLGFSREVMADFGELQARRARPKSLAKRAALW